MTSFDNENPVSSTAAAPAPVAESPNLPEENKTAEPQVSGPNVSVSQDPAPSQPVEAAHQAAEAHAQTV
ncbi:MAG: hypothetical protein WBR14_18240, partial [Candidatus Acidiferrum sp.]